MFGQSIHSTRITPSSLALQPIRSQMPDVRVEDSAEALAIVHPEPLQWTEASCTSITPTYTVLEPAGSLPSFEARLQAAAESMHLLKDFLLYHQVRKSVFVVQNA